MASKLNNLNLLDRVPPNDLECEQMVIGSVIMHPPILDDIGTGLRAEDFYAKENGDLFSTLLDMWERGRKIDTALLVGELKKRGLYESIGGAAAIARATGSVAHYAHATYYATRVRECSVRRQLIDMSLECVRECYDDTVPHTECLERHETNVLSIAEADIQAGPLDAMGLMHNALSELEARSSGASPGGIKTGYIDLDNMLGGMRPGQLIILAARPSMGKSALALNIAENVAMDAGDSVLFASLEMTSTELADRLLSSRAKVSAHKMRYGNITDKERQAIVECAAEMSQKNISVLDQSTQSVRFIAANARRMKRTSGLNLLVIDYLQLIEPEDRRDGREQQVARITRRLKGLAKDLACPILCLAQLNRQAEDGKAGEKPRLKHLRESGSIEQDADVVLFIHRDEYYRKTNENAGAAELIVAKQRSGPTGSVDLVYRKEFMRFETSAAPRHKEFDDYNNRDNEVFV